MKQKKYFTIIILETWSSVLDVIVSWAGHSGGGGGGAGPGSGSFLCRLDDDEVVGPVLGV